MNLAVFSPKGQGPVLDSLLKADSSEVIASRNVEVNDEKSIVD